MAASVRMYTDDVSGRCMVTLTLTRKVLQQTERYCSVHSTVMRQVYLRRRTLADPKGARLLASGQRLRKPTHIQDSATASVGCH